MQKRAMKKTPLPELESLRSRIDQVDEGLVKLMALRQQLATEAKTLKEANGMAMEDLAREAAVVRRASILARKRGLEPEVTRDVFWRLIGLSRTGPHGETNLTSDDWPPMDETPE